MLTHAKPIIQIQKNSLYKGVSVFRNGFRSSTNNIIIGATVYLGYFHNEI